MIIGTECFPTMNKPQTIKAWRGAPSRVTRTGSGRPSIYHLAKYIHKIQHCNDGNLMHKPFVLIYMNVWVMTLFSEAEQPHSKARTETWRMTPAQERHRLEFGSPGDLGKPSSLIGDDALASLCSRQRDITKQPAMTPKDSGSLCLQDGKIHVMIWNRCSGSK